MYEIAAQAMLERNGDVSEVPNLNSLLLGVPLQSGKLARTLTLALAFTLAPALTSPVLGVPPPPVHAPRHTPLCIHPRVLTPACAHTPVHAARPCPATFFEAHVNQQRVLGERQLTEAALALRAPQLLAQLRSRARAEAPIGRYGGAAAVGQLVEVLAGECAGQRGVLILVDNDANSYKAQLPSGQLALLKSGDFVSSGRTESGFLSDAMELMGREYAPNPNANPSPSPHAPGADGP
jgi:hypothetical protein